MEQSYNREPVKTFSIGLYIGLLLGGNILAFIVAFIPTVGFILSPLLIIVTGVFLIVMAYRIPKGLNQICYGDGEHTMNWIGIWLLSGITIMIFGVVYYYKIQKRMIENSKRYDAGISESSQSTILVLMLCGYITSGITWIIGFGIMASSFNKLVYAYNNSIAEEPFPPDPDPVPFPDPAPDPTSAPVQGKLRCLNGELAGASIILDNNHEIVIGRQADRSNIVLSSPKVSRAHCSISYDYMADQFYITDLSSNGTKLMNGSNLLSGKKTPVANNTQFELPDKSRFIVTSGPALQH